MSRSSDDEQDKLAEVVSRYKSTKGDQDRRHTTSSDNMAKARAAKLKALAAKREQIVNVSDADDEESEPKPTKSKGKAKAAAAAKPVKASKSDTSADEKIRQLEAKLAAFEKPATLIKQPAKGAEPKYNPCGF